MSLSVLAYKLSLVLSRNQYKLVVLAMLCLQRPNIPGIKDSECTCRRLGSSGGFQPTIMLNRIEVKSKNLLRCKTENAKMPHKHATRRTVVYMYRCALFSCILSRLTLTARGNTTCAKGSTLLRFSSLQRYHCFLLRRSVVYAEVLFIVFS